MKLIILSMEDASNKTRLSLYVTMFMETGKVIVL